VLVLDVRRSLFDQHGFDDTSRDDLAAAASRTIKAGQ
jgi:hypothetical protein